MLSNKPKILAPVRDEASFRAAVKAGADAVYFGVGELNMRVSSRGIDMEELPRIVSEAHERGAEVFITLNVIVYEHEVDKVREMVRKFKEVGVDAVICWDFAVIKICQELGMTFHVSTQASISNSSAGHFYEDLGARCIVLARECTLEQIKEVKSKMKSAKVEIFVHGAMCVSVSGRCFMSNFLECKSANRGECFQPCRREYTVRDKESGHELDVSNGFVMSPKDLCTIEILDKLVDTGVDYLKIEGRGRSPEYIQTTVTCYRRAVNAIENDEYTDELKDELLEQLKTVYNRGFSTGFMFGRPGHEAWSRVRNSQATEKKEYVGKVQNYYRKTNIAELKVLNGEVQVGDVLQFQGPTTGVERVAVENFEQHPDQEVTIKTEFVVRKSDEVYKIISR
ncbi:U32 family peptidase [Candidatus Uhrbacteria bacterium]|nr:U32 family peptidase [Candidatus Uhrbacteria bacterium]